MPVGNEVQKIPVSVTTNNQRWYFGLSETFSRAVDKRRPTAGTALPPNGWGQRPRESPQVYAQPGLGEGDDVVDGEAGSGLA
jgi:hypothetical protein